MFLSNLNIKFCQFFKNVVVDLFTEIVLSYSRQIFATTAITQTTCQYAYKIILLPTAMLIMQILHILDDF